MNVGYAVVAAVSLTWAVSTGWATDLPREGIKGEALNSAFRPLGITIYAPQDQPVVMIDSQDVYAGAAVSGARGDVVLVQQGGHPCHYTMEWDKAQTSISFNRSRLLAGPSGITHPVWTATAQNDAGQVLDSVGEAEIRSYSNVPVNRFTLSGAGIKRVVFWGDDKGFDAFCNVIIDTVNTITTQ